MPEVQPPESQTEAAAQHCRLLVESHRRLTGLPLVDPAWESLDGRALCDAVWHADAVVASHGTEDDPVLNYGNAAALRLWEANWEQFTSMPSRLTAEPLNREERASMLARVTSHGFIDDYAGIRISIKGSRFKIHRATVWNLVDAGGARHGQAVVFRDWSPL
jgi:hypothetical protein